MKANHAILAVIIASLFVVSTADANLVYRFQEGVWNGTVADAGYTTDDAGGRQNQNQDDNYNGATQEIKSGADPFHGVFGFDVSAASGIPVSSASLTLTVSYDGGFSDPDATYSYELYELPAGNTLWSETTATYNDQVTSGVTRWFDADSSESNVAVAGLSGTLLDTLSQIDPVNNETVTFTIPAIVATDWVQDPSSFGGLFLRQINDGTGTDRTIWHMSESSTASFRPLLTLTQVPEPSSAVLLLLGAAALLSRRRRK